jgi:hypothetical protein
MRFKKTTVLSVLGATLPFLTAAIVLWYQSYANETFWNSLTYPDDASNSAGAMMALRSSQNLCSL